MVSGAPPIGPVDIVIENNRIAAIRSAGTPGLPLRANRAPEKPDHEIDAHRHVRAAWIRQPARARGRRAEESRRGVSVQALARARHHHRRRRAADRARAHGQRARAQQPQRDRRASPGQLPARRHRMGARGGGHAGSRAGVGAVGRGQRPRRHEARRASSRDHGSAAGRSEKAQARIDGAPAADRRRADERARRGPRSGSAP